MTPQQFLARMKKGAVAPAYLFAGTEALNRERCRAALMEAALAPEERAEGVTKYDLDETSLREVVDDARTLSLFAPRRVIVAGNAEQALPRAKSDEDDGPAGDDGGLAAYLADPTPGVVLLVEAVRFDFEGEDKKKLDRVRKFYGAVTEVVELKRYNAGEAREEAQRLARAAGVEIDPGALELLVEALGADAARIAVEIEKLALYAPQGRAISEDDIAALVPDARAANIFSLVNALGRRDRARSLQLLDTLMRDG
ncbi:MAG: DNA polymerase III subunit delta, partial [Bryobacteraceae bacterium]